MKFTKNLLLITVSTFFFFYSFHSFLILPLRIVELGGTEFDIGLIMSIAGVSTIMLTPLSGILGDIYKKKYLIMIGSLILSITNFSFIYFDNLYYSYLFLRFLQGCCFSFFFVSAGTLVAETTEKANQTQALGFLGVFAILNHALAPTVSAEIVKIFSYDIFFTTAAISSFVSFLISLNLDTETKKRKNKNEKINFLELFNDKKFLLIYSIMYLIGGSFLTCLNFGAVFADSFDITPITTFFIAYTVVALIMRLFFGWIPDQYGPSKILQPFLLFYGFSIFVLSFSDNFWTFLISGAIFGFSHALVYPSLYSLALMFSKEENKAKSFSICSVSFTLGGMIFSIIYGLVAELYSFKVMYLSCSIIVTIGFFFLTKMLHKEIVYDDR